jgi:hypothetical protein
MEPNSPPVCRHCGKPMAFATRISVPRQLVYRCDSCKAQAWIPERRGAPHAPPAQQQQQPQQPEKKDTE